MTGLRNLTMIAGIASGLLAAGGAAHASTADAWAAMEKKVSAGCVAKSGLSRARLMPGKLSFSDEIGTEVRMVRGTDRRGRQVTRACAFQRGSGKVEVQDAPDWNRGN
jgi:hypothetical protein